MENSKKSVVKIILTTILSLFGVFLIVVFAMRIYLSSAYYVCYVVGDSMNPTFSGSAGKYEYIMFKKVKQKTILQRFDIVALHYTDEVDWIKRIVALPNEKVYYSQGHLYINDVLVNEPFVSQNYFNETFATETYQLLENEYFVIGDNRALGGTSYASISKKQIYGVNGFVFKTCSQENKSGWGIFEHGCKITYRKIKKY